MIVNVKRFKFLGQAEGNAVSDFTFQRKSQIVRLKREMGSKSDNNILGITFEILKYFEAGSLICPTHTFLNVYLRLSGNHVLKCLNVKSDHIKNIFTWKKKIIFEKDKPSGAYEVTIELRILQYVYISLKLNSEMLFNIEGASPTRSDEGKQRGTRTYPR